MILALKLMLLRPTLLLLNVSMVTNGKINYFDLALVESLMILLGAGLWVVGIDVWQGVSRARKIGGALVLALAALYSLGWLGANYWAYQQLKEMLGP